MQPEKETGTGRCRGSRCQVFAEEIGGVETEPREWDQCAQASWEMDPEHPQVRASSIEVFFKAG